MGRGACSLAATSRRGHHPPTVSTVSYLREVSQHLRHLISSLSTADVDDDVRVGELGESLGDDSLPTAKGSRDGRRTSLDTPGGEGTIGEHIVGIITHTQKITG